MLTEIELNIKLVCNVSVVTQVGTVVSRTLNTGRCHGTELIRDNVWIVLMRYVRFRLAAVIHLLPWPPMY